MLQTLRKSNQDSLTEYPLSKSSGYNGFFSDAKFVQFDNFIPVLYSISVVEADLVLKIRLKEGLCSIFVPTASLEGVIFRKDIEFAGKQIGYIVFGSRAYEQTLEEFVNGEEKVLNIPFLASTVISVPSTAGVYSLDGKTGELTFSDSTEVTFSDEGANTLKISAKTLPTVQNTAYLKTVNTRGPINNAIFLKLADILRVRTAGPSALTLYLVGADQANNEINHVQTSNG